MTHDFTHDELNLLCIYLADNRNDAISSLGAVLLEIEDSDMRMLCFSTMLKLREMEDEEYLCLLDSLYPDFDLTED